MKKPLTTDNPDDLRMPLLEAALDHVPFEGWHDKITELAAHDLDLDPGLARLAFPGGVNDMIDLLAQTKDQEMVIHAKELEGLKIREKITKLVRMRLEAEMPVREACRAALTHLALPMHSAQGLKILYRTVDLMWKTIHDPSTDFNYYTKRMTLAGVYSATLLYWLNDESENYTDTWAFLDRRIENVMQIEKTKAKMRGITDKMPDIWGLIHKYRHPHTP